MIFTLDISPQINYPKRPHRSSFDQGKVRWKIFEGVLHAYLLINFFKRLAKDTDHKVFLIFDDVREATYWWML